MLAPSFAGGTDLSGGRRAADRAHLPRFSGVREADRIDVLDGGEVVEHGTHEELMARGGRDAEMFSLQAAAYRD